MSSLAAGQQDAGPKAYRSPARQKAQATSSSSVGGVVPRQDYQFLFDHGVAAVFGPGTNVLDAARALVDLVEGKRR